MWRTCAWLYVALWLTCVPHSGLRIPIIRYVQSHNNRRKQFGHSSSWGLAKNSLPMNVGKSPKFTALFLSEVIPNNEAQVVRSDAVVTHNGKRKYNPRDSQNVAAKTGQQLVQSQPSSHISVGVTSTMQPRGQVHSTHNAFTGTSRRVYIPRSQHTPTDSSGLQKGLLNTPSSITLTDPKVLLSLKYPKIVSDLKRNLMETFNHKDATDNEDSSPAMTETSSADGHNGSSAKKKYNGDDRKFSKSNAFTRRRLTLSHSGPKHSEGSEREPYFGDFGNTVISEVPWEILCEMEEEGLKPSEMCVILQNEYRIKTTPAAIEFRLSDRSSTGRGKRKSDIARRKKMQSLRTRKDSANEHKQPPSLKLPLVESISIVQFGELIKKSPAVIIKHLMLNHGLMVTITQHIKRDIAVKVIEDFGLQWEDDVDEELFDKLNTGVESSVSKPPVVTIMGHVDHGKTTILDFIRKSRVAISEAGGITQAISAFCVPVNSDRNITFIDTPGHAAFTEMRKRGAKITDIVVLVIAADDGIMQQTIESINAARSAQCPIVVAINKIDKSNSQKVEKIKQDLLNYDIVVEDFGGDVQCAEISAKSGLGMDIFMEKILIQADVMQLTTSQNATLEGSIIESSIDKGIGSAAIAIIRNGNITVGDFVVAGGSWGKVRLLTDDRNNRISQAFAGVPIKIVGFHGVPKAGEMILKACDEDEAKRVAANRAQYTKAVATDAKSNQLVTKALDSLTLDSVVEKQQINLPIIVKADVVGSMEAIRSSLLLLNDSDHHHFAKVAIVQDGVGDVTVSDVNTAAATKAAIFAFNVATTSTVPELARAQNVELSYYSVLYDLLDYVKALLHRSLSPPLDGKIIGSATVRKVFKLGKAGKIAGCEVTEGTIVAAEKVRVVRDGKTVVYDGVMNSLKIVKEAVLEVKSGSECGIGLKDFHDILEGDVIQSYQL